jgi:hypothetical protein
VQVTYAGYQEGKSAVNKAAALAYEEVPTLSLPQRTICLLDPHSCALYPYLILTHASKDIVRMSKDSAHE